MKKPTKPTFTQENISEDMCNAFETEYINQANYSLLKAIAKMMYNEQFCKKPRGKRR